MRTGSAPYTLPSFWPCASPRLATGAAPRMPGTAGGMAPSLAPLPVRPHCSSLRPVGCIQMYECGRRVLRCQGVDAERSPRRCRGLTRQRCCSPWLRLLGAWTSFLHLWACTTRSRANQGTFRHLESLQEGNSERSESCFHCFYGKTGVSFFFFSSLQNITFFSQLKENQFYFVMCLTREVPWLPSWRRFSG